MRLIRPDRAPPLTMLFGSDEEQPPRPREAEKARQVSGVHGPSRLRTNNQWFASRRLLRTRFEGALWSSGVISAHGSNGFGTGNMLAHSLGVGVSN
eukprot:6196586-Pleurochrysis_carterae.AAC.5